MMDSVRLILEIIGWVVVFCLCGIAFGFVEAWFKDWRYNRWARKNKLTRWVGAVDEIANEASKSQK